jgi:hypothetical protein
MEMETFLNTSDVSMRRLLIRRSRIAAGFTHHGRAEADVCLTSRGNPAAPALFMRQSPLAGAVFLCGNIAPLIDKHCGADRITSLHVNPSAQLESSG